MILMSLTSSEVLLVLNVFLFGFWSCAPILFCCSLLGVVVNTIIVLFLCEN